MLFVAMVGETIDGSANQAALSLTVFEVDVAVLRVWCNSLSTAVLAGSLIDSDAVGWWLAITLHDGAWEMSLDLDGGERGWGGHNGGGSNEGSKNGGGALHFDGCEFEKPGCSKDMSMGI